MLVLSRQRDETIMIGDDIEVTVIDIRGDKVRIGINAPRQVSVHRKEIYDAIRRENAAAALAAERIKAEGPEVFKNKLPDTKPVVIGILPAELAALERSEEPVLLALAARIRAEMEKPEFTSG